MRFQNSATNWFKHMNSKRHFTCKLTPIHLVNQRFREIKVVLFEE